MVRGRDHSTNVVFVQYLGCCFDVMRAAISRRVEKRVSPRAVVVICSGAFRDVYRRHSACRMDKRVP